MSLCFDISQFCRCPAASGIQRVLLQIARYCSDDDRFVVRDVDDELLILTPSSAERLLVAPFDASRHTDLVDRARDECLGVLSEQAIFGAFATVVLPELTFDRSLLTRWSSIASAYPGRVGAIFHDAAPEMHREIFGVQAPTGAGRYFRLVAGLDRVACVSHDARRQLAEISRRDESTLHVVPNGADHLEVQHAADGHQIVVVGDLKAKKRVEIVLRAFESVRRRIDRELVIIGRSIPGEEQTTRLVMSSVERGRVRWLQDIDDATLARELSRASASVFIAAYEGFGLPALEALHAGVPLIADASLPSLRYVEPGGQIRLAEVTDESVAAALELVSGPAQQQLREEARQLSVPTWREFMDGVQALFMQ